MRFEICDGGVRLDAALLSAHPTSTRAFVREAIESGAVLVNGRRAPKGLKLRGGETIEVRELAEAADNVVRADPSVRVPCLFEDDALLAYDKPAGMPVQPLSRTETGTLMNGVVARHPECIPLGDRPLMAGAVHRIDADTSGLVLVARTAAAFENLRAQFAAQTVEKTYLALVEGSVAVGATLEHNLIHDPTLPFCRMIDARRDRHSPIAGRLFDKVANSPIAGRLFDKVANKPIAGRLFDKVANSPIAGQADNQPFNKTPDEMSRAASFMKTRPLHAITRYTPIAHTTVENEERTLLEVKIFTGVTHQIRAQLALAGLHIVNDRLYGAFAVENQTGHCLHALAAKFTHPVSGLPVEIRTGEPAWADLR